MSVRVTASARLHFGFLNLSMAHERLYGGLGVALDEPRTVVTAEPAEGVHCDHPDAERYAKRAVELCSVPGASISVERALPRHTGLGSGTQLALATVAAVARANDCDPAVRDRAPALGRGGRSGIGVAAFESGGIVLDSGHPTARFTSEPPERGEWTVPPVAARHDVPENWRFVLVLPDAEPGRSGDGEDAAIRRTVEDADPDVADRIARIAVQRFLPAIGDGDADAFGAAVEEIGRLNGSWYAEEQGGVYRPPVGAIVDELAADSAVTGAGQSSWGPAVYGVTTADRAADARAAAERALDVAGVDGTVTVVAGRNRGATVEF